VVLGRRRLQLEVELAAEALAQREPPRLVDPAAERRMEHELHAAGLVEEAFEHERVAGGNDPQRPAPLGEILDRLGRAVLVQAGLLDQPLDHAVVTRRLVLRRRPVSIG
jgi:hypothetical protein